MYDLVPMFLRRIVICPLEYRRADEYKFTSECTVLSRSEERQEAWVVRLARCPTTLVLPFSCQDLHALVKSLVANRALLNPLVVLCLKEQPLHQDIFQIAWLSCIVRSQFWQQP